MSIADKITSITNHLEKDYQALESVVGKVSVNKNIENIAPLLDNLWEDLPKTTGSGTSPSISDTRAGKMKLSLKGNTSQYSTTGKNLLKNWVHENDTTVTDNNVTFTKNSDGSITANGTANGNATYYFINEGSSARKPISAGSYVLNGCPSGGGNSTFKMTLGITDVGEKYDTGSSVSFNVASDTTCYFKIIVYSGYQANNLTFYPMISTSGGDYEPYTGGQPSPNPSYPQKVNVVSGDNEVVVEGKNLCISSSKVSNAIISFVPSKAMQKTFTLSFETNETLSGNSMYLYLDGANADAIGYISGSGNITKTITLTDEVYNKIQNATTIEIRIYKNQATFNTPQYAMIVNGSSASDYQPYQSSTYPINLPNGMWVGKIPNTTYKDKFIRNSGKNLYNDRFSDYTQPTDYRICPIKLEQGHQYVLKATLKGTTMSGVVVAAVPYGNKYSDFSTKLNMAITSTGTANSILLTIDDTWTSPKLAIYANDEETFNSIFENYNIQLEKGNTATSYEPYGNGDWYLNKRIAKTQVSLDNTVYDIGIYKGSTCQPPNKASLYNGIAYCNKALIATTAGERVENRFYENPANFMFVGSSTDTATTLKEKFDGSDLYYVLATPTYTKITGTLAEQLEDVWRAYSYKGQTNISQINNDLPFELSVTALEG